MTERNPQLEQAPRLFTRAEARRLTEAKVLSIPRPDFTETWHPYTHKDVINATKLALEKFKVDVGKKIYSLSSDGVDMFGLWEIGKRNGKTNALGFRNSIGKRMSIGYTSVLTVVVCTNQITHANWFIVRKHTSQLDVAELGGLAEGAIEKVMKDFDVLDSWHEGLREVEIGRQKANTLIVEAMRKQILAPSKFHEFDKLYFGDDATGVEPVYDQTLYGFHGTLTQLIRDTNLHVNADKNRRITQFVDDVRKKTH